MGRINRLWQLAVHVYSSFFYLFFKSQFKSIHPSPFFSGQLLTPCRSSGSSACLTLCSAASETGFCNWGGKISIWMCDVNVLIGEYGSLCNCNICLTSVPSVWPEFRTLWPENGGFSSLCRSQTCTSCPCCGCPHATEPPDRKQMSDCQVTTIDFHKKQQGKREASRFSDSELNNTQIWAEGKPRGYVVFNLQHCFVPSSTRLRAPPGVCLPSFVILFRFCWST